MNNGARRTAYIDKALEIRDGVWPDLEGLIRDIYVHHVKAGDTVVDVGVNRGSHLYNLAKAVGASGRVVGIEAVPAYLSAVEECLAADWKEISKQTSLHNCAVGREPGRAEFFVSKLNDGGLSGLKFRKILENVEIEKIQVEIRTLDEILSSESAASFVKIDIEGGEFDALCGAPILLKRKPLIAFEFDDTAPKSFNFDSDELTGLMQDNGYRIYDVFGFEVFSGVEMEEARVWNFIAAPEGLDGIALTAPARATLTNEIPELEQFGP